jgi:hypothetical protein
MIVEELGDHCSRLYIICFCVLLCGGGGGNDAPPVPSKP